MKKSVFYHAGCPVCTTAEQEILELMDPSSVEVVHLGKEKSKNYGSRKCGCKIRSCFGYPFRKCITHKLWCFHSRR